MVVDYESRSTLGHSTPIVVANKAMASVLLNYAIPDTNNVMHIRAPYRDSEGWRYGACGARVRQIMMYNGIEMESWLEPDYKAVCVICSTKWRALAVEMMLSER